MLRKIGKMAKNWILKSFQSFHFGFPFFDFEEKNRKNVKKIFSNKLNFSILVCEHYAHNWIFDFFQKKLFSFFWNWTISRMSKIEISKKVCQTVKKPLWASCSQRRFRFFRFVTDNCFPESISFFKFRRRKSREYEKWKVQLTLENTAKIDCEHNAQKSFFRWNFLLLRICFP